MDGTTEPIIAVLGHPIAGNPSQFALERALKSMEMDWRVMSLDVKPDDISTAIAGAWVMGIRGVMLDPAVAMMTAGDSEAKAQQTGESEKIPAPPSCFFRDPEHRDNFRTENAQSKWLEEVIQSHFQAQETSVGPVLLIGERDWRFPSDMIDIDTQSPIAWAASESIEQSKLIVLSEFVDVQAWPADDGTTLVVDLTQPQAIHTDDQSGLDISKLRELGYAVVDAEELRAAGLSQCLLRWTGIRPPIEILQEAIEEYLAV